jgi:phenylacetic acid degradation protein
MPCYAIDGIVPIVDCTAFVHPTAVLIGDVIVGPNCYIGPCASLRGDFGRIIVGAGANIQDSCTLHSFPGKHMVVEENGHIGHGAVLHGCTVERDALVGINAVILDGATIGAQSIVGASTLVASGMQIAARSLVIGVPAKVQRQLRDDEISRKLEGTLVYQRLVRRCKQSLVEATPLSSPEDARVRLASAINWPCQSGD